MTKPLNKIKFRGDECCGQRNKDFDNKSCEAVIRCRMAISLEVEVDVNCAKFC